MKIVRVKSSQGAYPVLIGKGLLNRIGDLLSAYGPPARGESGALPAKVMIVTQEPVAKWHLDAVKNSLLRKKIRPFTHILPDSEAAKSEKELFRLYKSLISKDFERRDRILALGGGVTGDLAGFAAATYMRGIPFINVPTTLLAQVDSSIGGKTGINLAAGKNLIGAFYPPQLVISDIASLSTLPARQYQASLAEVIKYGIIRSPDLVRFLEKKNKEILAKDSAAVASVVESCARIKARVVSRDERETKGERMILNYGHTFAHGFENALGYQKLMHGEAVAIGMVCAARIAVLSRLLAPQGEQRQNRLIRQLKLPDSLKGFRLRAADILSAMMHDKKKRGGRLRFVLPVRIGRVVIKSGIPETLIRKVIIEIGAKH